MRFLSRLSTLRSLCLLPLLLLSWMASSASAQEGCLQLTAEDATAMGVFGRSLDVADSYLAVGAAGNILATPPVQPAAYVFEQTTEGWLQRARLTLDDPTEPFGFHVAMGSDLLATAGPRREATLYERGNAGWQAAGKIPDYGHVILRGDTLLIGGPGASDPNSPFAAGAVRVYVRRQGTWNQIQIIPGREEENFGQYFVLDGNWLVAAGWGGMASSHVKIFRRPDSLHPWQLETEFIVSATSPVSLDLEGDRLIVGVTENANHAAAVYEYRWEGQAWNRVAEITPPEGARRAFGEAVALQGDSLAVGDPSDAELAFTSGAVHLYRWQDPAWEHIGRITPGVAAGDAGFGSVLEIEQGLLFVGAPYDDSRGNAAGAVYLCPFEPGTTVNLTCPDPSATRTSRCHVPVIPVDGLVLVPYPNPFTTIAALTYAVPGAGPHTAHFDAAGLAAGPYVCVLRSEAGTAVKALVLAR